MKGQYERWVARQQAKTQSNNGNGSYTRLYEEALSRSMTDAQRSISTQQIDTGSHEISSNSSLKIGRLYYILCPDDQRFYRSVYIKANPLSSARAVQALVSNPVMGVPPSELEQISPAQLTRYMNSGNSFDLNAMIKQSEMNQMKFKEWSDSSK